jgi:hypothetical protein
LRRTIFIAGVLTAALFDVPRADAAKQAMVEDRDAAGNATRTAVDGEEVVAERDGLGRVAVLRVAGRPTLHLRYAGATVYAQAETEAGLSPPQEITFGNGAAATFRRGQLAAEASSPTTRVAATTAGVVRREHSDGLVRRDRVKVSDADLPELLAFVPPGVAPAPGVRPAPRAAPPALDGARGRPRLSAPKLPELADSPSERTGYRWPRDIAGTGRFRLSPSEKQKDEWTTGSKDDQACEPGEVAVWRLHQNAPDAFFSPVRKTDAKRATVIQREVLRNTWKKAVTAYCHTWGAFNMKACKPKFKDPAVVEGYGYGHSPFLSTSTNPALFVNEEMAIADMWAAAGMTSPNALRSSPLLSKICAPARSVTYPASAIKLLSDPSNSMLGLPLLKPGQRTSPALKEGEALLSCPENDCAPWVRYTVPSPFLPNSKNYHGGNAILDKRRLNFGR